MSHPFGDHRPLCYEFDPLNGDSFERVPDLEVTRDLDVTHLGSTIMLLPTGEVLLTYNSMAFVYTPEPDSREPQASWRPHLESPSGWLTAGAQYTARGTLFNGITQAICNVQWKKIDTATNYPIIRLASIATGTVVYPRSYGHSSMGVATGSAPQNTNFKIPLGFPAGEADLSVIANGIESNRIRVNIVSFGRIKDPYHEVLQLIGNLADGPLFIIGPNGIRPVPPFGPNDIVFAKQFREKTLKAYRYIFTGMLLMNNESLQQEKSVNEMIMHHRAKSEMDHGLMLLRELSIELDQHLEKNVGVPGK